MRALGRRDFEVLTDDFYERDDPMLIEYIVRNILPRRGITARPEEVLLTMGAQNALWLAAQVLTGPGARGRGGKPLLSWPARDPGAAWRARFCPVDVDEDGLPPDAVPKDVRGRFSPRRAIIARPMRRCRSSAALALLDRAAEEDFLIVEDDYEFEMSFLKPAAPALKSLDREGRVIYAGSFSKSLFPGLRLGYLVASEAFIREARALRAAMLRHPPGHIQRTLAYFLSLGHYDALVNRLNQAYKRRRTVMDDAINAEGLEIAGRGAFGGSSFWMRAPDGGRYRTGWRLIFRAKGVLIEPGRIFFDPATAPRNYYRLAYSSIAQTRIPDGIAHIAEAIRRAGPKRP